MLKNMTAAEVVVTDSQREAVLAEFPILKEMQDENLREKVVRLWVRVWLMCGKKTLAEIPNEQAGGYSLVSHCRAVANAAYGMGKVYVNVFKLPINFDHLIAAAVIHDIDKPLCYTFDEKGAMILSEFGKMMPHGAYGTYAAFDEGMPVEVAHIPKCHSAYSSKVHSGTPEGILVEYADKGVARTLVVGMGGTLPIKTGYGG